MDSTITSGSLWELAPLFDDTPGVHKSSFPDIDSFDNISVDSNVRRPQLDVFQEFKTSMDAIANDYAFSDLPFPKLVDLNHTWILCTSWPHLNPNQIVSSRDIQETTVVGHNINGFVTPSSSTECLADNVCGSDFGAEGTSSAVCFLPLDDQIISPLDDLVATSLDVEYLESITTSPFEEPTIRYPLAGL